MDTIKGWHAYMASRDPAALDALLADGVVFQSPAVHTPQIGREITARYLLAAAEVLGKDGFRYTGEWRTERSAVLEFECTVEGLFVNGVDVIHWNESGRITRFKVMLRPFKACGAVMPKMVEALATDRSAGG